jgi:ABC-2 type transport system permease protein
MRIFAVIKKALIMQIRDYWALLLTIISAPFFLLIYYVMTGGSSTTYNVNYFYADSSEAKWIKAQFVSELKAVRYANGESALNISEAADTVSIKNHIKNRNVDLLITVPRGFSDSILTGNVPHILIHGEASNPKYTVGTVFTISAIESMVQKATGKKPLFTFQEKFMGNSLTKSEFDIYAPGIFIFSIIMLLLSASLSIIRDIEDKTMIRLKLTKMTVFDYLLGNAFVQWIVGIISFILSMWLAVRLGFNSQGSPILILLVCSLTILSILGICLILVSFCKNATMVMIVGNFPLFILMFFTGAMIPLPRREIITGFALNDMLSPTHSVIALNKIFTYGAGFREIRYEMLMLGILTIVYSMIGLYFFKRNHLIKNY